MKNEKLTRAAELLFCDENPFELQAAVFATDVKVTFLDIRKFEGNLFTILASAEAYLREKMNWRVRIAGLEREEIPEIPLAAIREALVNSICHRDYSNPKGNEIAIFKNRIEIYNPGSLPQGLTPEDFLTGKERSFLRNPLIAEVFYRTGDIEKWGSGFKRIFEECQRNAIKVKFEVLKSGFLTVFYRPDFESKIQADSAKTTQKTTLKTTQKILKILRTCPTAGRKQIASIIGDISEDGVKYQLNKLKQQGIIRRVGPAKGGYWEVIGE